MCSNYYMKDICQPILYFHIHKPNKKMQSYFAH